MGKSEIKFQSQRSRSIVAPEKYPEKYLNKYRKKLLSRYIIRENVFIELGDVQNKKILDMGCGDGEISVLCALLGAEVFGYDISPDLIKIAKQRSKINSVNSKCHFEVADLERLSFQPEKYDFIISFGTLHHTKFDRYFNKVAVSLKDDGKFIIVEPVNLSPSFNNFIKNIKVKKRKITSTERPLSREDVGYISSILHISKIRGYNLFARIARLLNGDNLTETGSMSVKTILKTAHFVDYFLFPIFNRFYRVVFIVGEKK